MKETLYTDGTPTENDYDLDQTIRFTREDLQKLRSRQDATLDSDYFTQSSLSNRGANRPENQPTTPQSTNPFQRKNHSETAPASQRFAKQYRHDEPKTTRELAQQVQEALENSQESDGLQEVTNQEAKPSVVTQLTQSVGEFFERMKQQVSQISKRQESAPSPEEAPTTYETEYSYETLEEPIIIDDKVEEAAVVEPNHDDHQSLVKGTAWLTFGNVFSRILGALYIIPWATWLGASYTQGNVLYSIGYKPYSLFLAIATAGFPSAIAKQIAFFHSKKEYRVADKLFKNSLLVMLATGLISGGVLFLMAPVLAGSSATDNAQAATLVIRSLVPALFILPVMSLIRGYFQGFNNMVPTAVSQIIEQIARVIYMLAGTYAVMQLANGNVTEAVVHSTFAAFIGAFGSLVYLVIVYIRRMPMIHRLIATSQDEMDLDFKESVRIMLVDSVPFILLGSGIILAQMIDFLTFRPIMINLTLERTREISELYGAISLDVDKLIMIIISLAVALSTSAIPAVTHKFAERDIIGTSALVERVTVLFCYVMLPAAVGMASMSQEVYQMFYPTGIESGPQLLVTACYMSIVLGAYTVLSAILQSMDFRRLTIQYLFIGLAVKMILQVPSIWLFHGQGALVSMLIAFLVTSVLMWLQIHRTLLIDYKSLVPQLAKIAMATAVMGMATSLWGRALSGMLGEVGRGLTFVKVILVVFIGVFIYFAIMALFGMLPVLFGNRHQELQDKLKVM